MAAACSSSGAASPSASAAAVVSTAPSEAASVAPSVAPSASLDPCDAANLTTLTAGTLTIGTDNPAYPPYFAENADGSKTAPWELGDPTNGKGFESAFAYNLATTLGFRPDQVAWTYVPFDSSYAPGAKTFDLDINQISYSAERAAGRRPVRWLLLREPGRRVAGRQPRREGDHGHRPGQVSVRRADRARRATRPSPTSSSRPPRSASTTRTTRRSPRSTPSRSTPSSWTCRPRSTWPPRRSTNGKVVGQFEAPTGADAGALQRRPRQGQPAHRVREYRDRDAEGQRPARQRSRRNGCRARSRPRSSPRRRPARLTRCQVSEARW